MLRKFLSQALTSDRVHADKSFREMLNLSLSCKDIHAFADESLSTAGSSGKSKERMLKFKSGSKVQDFAGSRSRASLAGDRKNIKTVSVWLDPGSRTVYHCSCVYDTCSRILIASPFSPYTVSLTRISRTRS